MACRHTMLGACSAAPSCQMARSPPRSSPSVATMDARSSCASRERRSAHSPPRSGARFSTKLAQSTCRCCDRRLRSAAARAALFDPSSARPTECSSRRPSALTTMASAFAPAVRSASPPSQTGRAAAPAPAPTSASRCTLPSSRMAWTRRRPAGVAVHRRAGAPQTAICSRPPAGTTRRRTRPLRASPPWLHSSRTSRSSTSCRSRSRSSGAQLRVAATTAPSSETHADARPRFDDCSRCSWPADAATRPPTTARNVLQRRAAPESASSTSAGWTSSRSPAMDAGTPRRSGTPICVGRAS